MAYYVVFFIMMFVIVYLLCRLLILKKSIARASWELREISEALDENRVVKMAAPEKELEELLEVMNRNLKAIRIERRKYQQEETRLKEQIENISHDLRTPLTAVLGYLKMIDPDRMDVADREYLEIAVRKSHTLQNLIGRFYELSRVTSESFELKLVSVDALRILKETCLDHYGLFEQKHLEMKLPMMEGAVMISGDAEALQRVFTNLIQNSIRYAKSELDIKLVRNQEEGTVKFIFSNDIEDGQEIPEPERLFDRFYMQERSRHQGGTGLGLTISRSLVEHMNGMVSAEYAGETGKRFLVLTICFPQRKMAEG